VDSRPDVTPDCTWPGTARALKVGEKATCTARSAMTQDDIDAKEVVNTVTATGKAPDGTEVTDDSVAKVPTATNPKIELVKTGAIKDGQKGAVGDTIIWSFEITNTGNVTLVEIELLDSLPGLINFTWGKWPERGGTLKPGEKVTATAEYVITKADGQASSVTNNATVQGKDPGGTKVDDDATAQIKTINTGDPLKSASPIALVGLGVLLAVGGMGIGAMAAVKRRRREEELLL
jgi:uncharacterized repeat protein (TIGR01451 family)